MFKRLRKAVVLLAFAAALAVFTLGTATVTQTVTGHAPKAHADNVSAPLDIYCLADQNQNDNAQWVELQGNDQNGNWQDKTYGMSFVQGGPWGPPYTDADTDPQQWSGTVTAIFTDGWGGTWTESIPIDPSYYRLGPFGEEEWQC